MKRFLRLAIAAAACAVVTGCGSLGAPTAEMTEAPTPGDVRQALAELEDGGSIVLDGVSIHPSQGYGIDAGTREDEVARDHDRADVGAFETVNGLETKLTFPVWWGAETTYQVMGGKPRPLREVVETEFPLSEHAWFAGPVVTVKLHTDDGVLILDNVDTPRTR